MPVKCSFCRRRYMRAGPYETHLRKAHADLDIILASTLRNLPPNRIDDPRADIIDHNEPRERPDSDYESDPASDPTGYERDAINDLTYDSDTKALNDNMSSSAARQTHYERAGEAIGDVNGFEQEHSNLCKNPWAPFTSAKGFKLASWFLESKSSKSQINDYFANGLGDAASVGYSSMYTLENLLRSLDPYGPYLQWFEGQVVSEDGKSTLPFFYRDILDCVRYLLRQITYRDDLVYAPRREFDQNGQRIYAEMHTADWWWDVQVRFSALLHLRLLTVRRKHFPMGRRWFQSLGCLIRRISPISRGTRRHGRSTLRSEIFRRLGVTDLDQWQFSFLRYCPFRPSLPSPRETNSRDRSMPTHFRAYSNSSLSP